jgi:stringent starvation protein B
MPDALPPKKDVANALLKGPSVFVHLDPRRDGVVVPKWFKQQFQLVLQVGLNMAVPIPDLEVTDDGISCTLSFNRSPFWCVAPWKAIYALVGEDGRGMIWPDDVPPELAAQAQRPALKVVDNKKPRRKPRVAASSKPTPVATVRPAIGPAAQRGGASKEAGPRKLAAVDSEPKAPPPGPPSSSGGDKPKLPPYLRVIK